MGIETPGSSEGQDFVDPTKKPDSESPKPADEKETPEERELRIANDTPEKAAARRKARGESEGEFSALRKLFGQN